MARTRLEPVLPSLAEPDAPSDASATIRMWGTRRIPGGGHALVEVLLPLDVAVQYITREDQPESLVWVIPRIASEVAKEVEKG